MSARDELFRRVCGAFVDEARANALIDAFAHELAEKIRAVNPQPDGWIDVAFDYAANLIDPTVGEE